MSRAFVIDVVAVPGSEADICRSKSHAALDDGCGLASRVNGIAPGVFGSIERLVGGG